MAPPEPPTKIKLRVKVPPGHIEGSADEFSLGTEVPVNATIGQVRQQIQQVIPSNPPPQTQRILYGGRALVDNDQTLADALNIRRDPTQDVYVIHLLVKGDHANGAPGASHRNVLNTPNRTPSPAQPAQPQPQPPLSRLLQQTTPAPTPPGVHPDHAQQHAAATAAAMEQHRRARLAAMGAHPPQNVIHHQLPPGTPIGPAIAQNIAAFQHAIAQQQRERAAMGMVGVGPHPNQGAPGQDTSSAVPPPTSQTPVTGGQSTEAPTSGAGAMSVGNAPQGPSQPQPQPHLPQTVPRRPISNQGFHMEGVDPQGNRFAIHQTTLNFGPNGPQMPPGFRIPSVMPGQNTAEPPAPSALDTARTNMAEMMRTIDELRAQSTMTEEQRARLTDLEQRAQAINNYIDPFRVGTSPPNAPGRSMPSIPPRLNMLFQPQLNQMPQFNPPMPLFPSLPQVNSTAALPANLNPANVACYLLSSPRGPEAIVYSPQYGAYTTRRSNPTQPLYHPSSHIQLHPTPTTSATATTASHHATNQAPPAYQQPNPQIQAQPPPRPPAAANPAQPANAAPAQANALQPLLGHFWLLLRILIFAYFFLGGSLGWRRPLILAALGLGFWLVRIGLFGEGGVARRWWDEVVGVPVRPPPAAANGDARREGAGGEGADGRAGAVRAGRMPTPEQVAARLLEERRRAGNARVAWIRETLRPLERTVALLVASLWPGVGEAHVRAREEEERRLAEEEIERRRVEEEERRRVEEEKEKELELEKDGVEVPGEKAEGASETAGEASSAPTESSTAQNEASTSG